MRRDIPDLLGHTQSKGKVSVKCVKPKSQCSHRYSSLYLMWPCCGKTNRNQTGAKTIVFGSNGGCRESFVAVTQFLRQERFERKNSDTELELTELGGRT